MEQGMVAVHPSGGLAEMTVPFGFEVCKPQKRYKPEEQDNTTPPLASARMEALQQPGVPCAVV
jgi:hypothetical protein